MQSKLVVFCLWLCLVGCTTPSVESAPLPTLRATAVIPTTTPAQIILNSLPATYTPLPPTATATPFVEPTSTPRPVATATTDLYRTFTIDYLANQAYGTTGHIQSERTLNITNAFTRTLISYTSDGLTVYGFMNIPRTPPPHPVVLVLHGYIDPDVYQTIAYTAPYADALAEAGYLVIHPNYRNYPPSDSGENLFRIGYARDVLHLVGLVARERGLPNSLLASANDELYLFGHSMGGGIAIRTLVIDGQTNQHIDKAVLYGSMSGDEAANFSKIYEWSNQETGEFELAVPVQELNRISPIYFLHEVRADVAIHHGANDETTPLAWAEDLCQRFLRLSRTPNCVTYDSEGHNFGRNGRLTLIEQSIAFFQR